MQRRQVLLSCPLCGNSLMRIRGGWRGGRSWHPGCATLVKWSFWAEGNWEEADTRKVPCPPSICLKTRHQFSKVLYQERQKLITRDGLRPHQPGDVPEESTEQMLQTNLYLPCISQIFTFPQLTAFRSLKSLSFFLPFLYKLNVFCWRCYWSLISNCRLFFSGYLPCICFNKLLFFSC